MTRTGSGAASTSTRSTTSPRGAASSSRRARARISSSMRSIAAAGELAVEDAAPVAVLGRVHVQDRARRPMPPSRSGSFTSAPRPEQNVAGSRLIAADVVVAGDRLDPGRVLEHRRLGPQPGQHARSSRAAGRSPASPGRCRAHRSVRHRRSPPRAMRRPSGRAAGCRRAGASAARPALGEQPEPGHDRDAAHHGEDLEPLERLERPPGLRLVVRARRVVVEEPGHRRAEELVLGRLERQVPGEVVLGRADGGHLPVEHRGRAGGRRRR